MFSKFFNGSTYSLIGVVLISVFTFFGFRSLFMELDQDIASEALMAAFAALFVILPTSFLMEREGESRLKGDKRSAIFQSNLVDYKKSAADMARVLKNKKLTSEELSELRENHAFLVILGSKKSIDASREFISKCQKIMEDSDENVDGAVKLTAKNERDLWDSAIEFLGAARDGLDLGQDHFDLQAEKNAFRVLNEKQTSIEQKFPPRQELLGGHEEWCEVRNLGTEQSSAIKGFIKALRAHNTALKPKYTKTFISIIDTSIRSGKVAFFINSIDKEQKITITFAPAKNQNVVQNVIDDLAVFKPQTLDRKDGSCNIKVVIPYKNRDHSNIKKVHLAILDYMKPHKV